VLGKASKSRKSLLKRIPFLTEDNRQYEDENLWTGKVGFDRMVDVTIVMGAY